MTHRGIEPLLPPWKGGVLTAWPMGLINSPSRVRTYDPSVNSRMLCRWAIEEYFYLKSFNLRLKAATRFELVMKVLQTSALPLGYAAIWIWQPLTLPGRLQPSTISRLSLNLRVRYGNGCFPKSHRHQKWPIGESNSCYRRERAVS